MIKNVTGGEVEGCPWKAFNEAVCADVLNVIKWYESGQIGLALGADPPAHLIEGVEVFQSAMMAVRADRMDRQMAEVRRKRAANG